MIVSGIHIEKLTISHTIFSTESMMTSFSFWFYFFKMTMITYI